MIIITYMEENTEMNALLVVQVVMLSLKVGINQVLSQCIKSRISITIPFFPMEHLPSILK